MKMIALNKKQNKKISKITFGGIMKTSFTSTILLGLMWISGCGGHGAKFNDPYMDIRKIQYEQQLSVTRQEIKTGKYTAAFNRYYSLITNHIHAEDERRHLINLAVLGILAEDIDGYKEIANTLQKYKSDRVANFHIAFANFLEDSSVGGFSKKEKKILLGSSSKEQRLIHKWIRWLKREESGIGLANELIDLDELPEAVFIGSISGFVIPILDDLLGIQYFQIIL